MSRWGPLAVAVACAALVLAAPAPAADRLDRAAAALKRAPLYVHPDLLWLVPAGDRERVTSRLRASAAPVRVAVLPLVDEDESGGQSERALQGIRDRVGRSGFYVVMNQLGSIDVRGGGLRWYSLPIELKLPPRSDDGPSQAVPRLLRAIDVLSGRRPGPEQDDESDPQPLIDLGGDAAEPSRWRDGLIAAGVGLVAGCLAFGAATVAPVVARRRGRRG